MLNDSLWWRHLVLYLKGRTFQSFTVKNDVCHWLICSGCPIHRVTTKLSCTPSFPNFKLSLDRWILSFSVTALGIISYLFIAEKYCIVYRYPIICIHSSEISTISLLPRLGCCIFGLWLQECPLHFFIFSGFRFLGPKSTSMLFFKWPSILFSLLAEPMYIVINSAGGFPCLYTLSGIYSFLNNFI